VIFIGRKKYDQLCLKLPRAQEIDSRISQAGIEFSEDVASWGRYKPCLRKDDIAKNRELLKELIQMAYCNRAD
jgi:hypothetical protein